MIQGFKWGCLSYGDVAFESYIRLFPSFQDWGEGVNHDHTKRLWCHDWVIRWTCINPCRTQWKVGLGLGPS